MHKQQRRGKRVQNRKSKSKKRDTRATTTTGDTLHNDTLLIKFPAMAPHLLECSRAFGRRGRVHNRIRARIRLWVRVRVTGIRQRRTPHRLGARLGRASTLPLFRSCPVVPCQPGHDASGIRPCSAFYSLDVACARPITSACVSRITRECYPRAVVVMVVVVAAAAAGESSRCTPLAFMTRVLGPLWRLTRHRHILVSSSDPQYPRQLLSHELPCPHAFRRSFQRKSVGTARA